MSVSQAKVKSVLSGDTLVLVSVNNPNQERLLSLAFVSAPRFQRDREEVGYLGSCTILPNPVPIVMDPGVSADLHA